MGELTRNFVRQVKCKTKKKEFELPLKEILRKNKLNDGTINKIEKGIINVKTTDKLLNVTYGKYLQMWSTEKIDDDSYPEMRGIFVIFIQNFGLSKFISDIEKEKKAKNTLAI